MVIERALVPFFATLSASIFTAVVQRISAFVAGSAHPLSQKYFNLLLRCACEARPALGFQLLFPPLIKRLLVAVAAPAGLTESYCYFLHI